MTDLVYAVNRASVADICTHLAACDAQFSPPLSERVILAEYAGKLWANAQRFEAWHGGRLVGLVAIYCNDSTRQAAYVSSVSVDPALARRGIARRLLAAALAEAARLNFAWVALAVDERAKAALALYASMGFAPVSRTDRLITMGRIPKGPQ